MPSPRKTKLYASLRNVYFGIALLAFFIFLPVEGVFSQSVTLDQVRMWLQTEPVAIPYQDLSPDLLQVFDSAASVGIPLELLFDKLKEGMAKKVPFSRLKPVLEGELARLVKVRKLLEEVYGRDVEREPLYLQGMKVGSLALLSGFPQEGLSIVYSQVKGLERIVSLLPPLLEMHRIAPLPFQALPSFLQALRESSLPPSQYGTFVSLYLKAIAGRIPPIDILQIMTDVLHAGGGVLQIERELSRRTKR